MNLIQSVGREVVPPLDTLTISHSLEFADQLTKNICSLHRRSLLSDVVLELSGGKSIACHRLVLAAASPYFCRLFTAAAPVPSECPTSSERPVSSERPSPSERPGSSDLERPVSSERPVSASRQLHALRDFNSDAVLAMLQYCYSGDLQVTIKNVKEYIQVAEFLELKGLLPSLNDFVIGNLKPNNCVGFLTFAWASNGRKRLKAAAQSFVLYKFEEVTTSLDFRMLTIEQLIDFITPCALTFKDHDCILKACILWIIHDIRHRKKNFRLILNNLDLERCSVAYLNSVLKKYSKSVITSLPSYERIASFVLSHMENKEDVVYLVGGISNNKVNEKCWKITIKDSSNITVQEMAPLPPEATLVNVAFCSTTRGGIFAAGGSHKVTESLPSPQCFLYDRKDDTWLDLPPLSSPVEGASAVSLENNVYVMGGVEGRGDIVERLDLRTRTWYRCKNMIQPCASPILAQHDHFIYAIFNTADENRQHANESGGGGVGISVQRYNTRTNYWSFCASLPRHVKSTAGASVTTAVDKIYLFGGEDCLALMYSPHMNTWTSLTNSRSSSSFSSSSTTSPFSPISITTSVSSTSSSSPGQQQYQVWQAGMASVQGSVYVFGGKCGEQGEESSAVPASDRIQVWEPDDGTLTPCDCRLPVPVWKHHCLLQTKCDF